MKRILILLLLLLPLTSYAVEVGDKAPDFKVASLDSKRISYYSDFKGNKPVYLIFWATWCPICKSELPVWKNLHKQLGNKIEFIGINVGINEKAETVKEYVKKNTLNFTVIFDKEQKIIKAFGVMGTPTHIIIDRKGVIRYRDSKLPEDLGKHMEELLN